MLKIIIAFCWLASLMIQAQAQTTLTDNPLKTRLDSLVDRHVRVYFKDPKAVGLSLGILTGGQSHFYNYGETSAGNQRVPANTSFFELGSMTKSFTGILLAQALLDKKIALDADIRKYLKGDYPNLTYNGTPITIRQLANHTSGITRIFPNLWERANYSEMNPYSNYTRALLFEGLHQFKMEAAPGKVYSYSNMAVALLGCILEDAYHQNYFNLVSQYILRPLKLNDTRIELAGIPADQIAYPHNAKREVTSFWDLPEIPALGALRSNTKDLVKYILANDVESLPNIKLAHQRTFGTAQDGMALNWFLHVTPEGYRTIEHSGGTGGSRSSLQCLPELKSGFVILTNSLADRNGLEKELLKLVTAEARVTQ